MRLPIILCIVPADGVNWKEISMAVYWIAFFSFTTPTALGFGDIEPTGNLRYLTGIESLTGLVLITWTASFLFVEMQRYWNLK